MIKYVFLCEFQIIFNYFLSLPWKDDGVTHLVYRPQSNKCETDKIFNSKQRSKTRSFRCLIAVGLGSVAKLSRPNNVRTCVCDEFPTPKHSITITYNFHLKAKTWKWKNTKRYFCSSFPILHSRLSLSRKGNREERKQFCLCKSATGDLHDFIVFRESFFCLFAKAKRLSLRISQPLSVAAVNKAKLFLLVPFLGQKTFANEFNYDCVHF